MKRPLCLITLLTALPFVKAEDYNVVYNVVSDDIQSIVENVPVQRIINSGTVIIPEFDESCPEELKAPFSYACKLVEEYMLPSLPLRVKVSVEDLTGSQRNAISKVSNAIYENFGSSSYYNIATISTIKGVIFGEICYNTDVTYLQYVPDLDFLTKNPDINIIYNKQKIDEIYFSLDTEPGDKYDFVSLAIRDIIRGLGVYHNFLYNRIEGEIQNVKGTMLPFELVVDKALGVNSSAEERLAKATQGELPISSSLKLYAPATWENGVSLNYFIPGEYKVSQVLSHDFCKGTVRRSLNENSEYLFNGLLGWIYDFTVGTSSPSTSTGGNTELKMDYNGTFYLGNLEPEYGSLTRIDTNSTNLRKPIQRMVDSDNNSVLAHMEAVDYVYQFYPYYNPAYEDPTSPGDGFTVSILKKDGTWDVVFGLTVYFPGIPYELNMSECEFHCDPDEYERTVEGYLKARIATKFTTNFGYTELRSTFFVIDYLPPKVKLRYNFIADDIVSVSDGAASPNATGHKVRLYFSDAEGVDHIILECLRQGARFPNKILINDLKKGYFDVTIDRNTTFTAVAYNDNGQTRGIPVTVELLSQANVEALSFQLHGDDISVKTVNDEISTLDYSITPLTAGTPQLIHSGRSEGNIDISNLSQGLYVLHVIDNKTGVTGSFKFNK